MLAQIADDKFLAAKFVRALYAGGEHRVAFGRIASDDEDETRVFDIFNRAGIAAVTDRAP